MIHVKKIDWSYNNTFRYIIDLHIYFLVVLLFAYLYGEEPPANSAVVIVIFVWFLVTGGWLSLRLIDFLISKSDPMIVSLSRQRVAALEQYIKNNNCEITKEAVTDLALEEYLLKKSVASGEKSA